MDIDLSSASVSGPSQGCRTSALVVPVCSLSGKANVLGAPPGGTAQGLSLGLEPQVLSGVKLEAQPRS